MPTWKPTREQHVWLMARLTEFQLLSPHAYDMFWTQFYDEWLQRWPEREVLWPDQSAMQMLTEDERSQLFLAEQERKYVSHSDVSSVGEID
jgi:hypothetical protein